MSHSMSRMASAASFSTVRIAVQGMPFIFECDQCLNVQAPPRPLGENLMDGSTRVGVPGGDLSPFWTRLTPAGAVGLDVARWMASNLCVSLRPAQSYSKEKLTRPQRGRVAGAGAGSDFLHPSRGLRERL